MKLQYNQYLDYQCNLNVSIPNRELVKLQFSLTDLVRPFYVSIPNRELVKLQLCNDCVLYYSVNSQVSIPNRELVKLQSREPC